MSNLAQPRSCPLPVKEGYSHHLISPEQGSLFIRHADGHAQVRITWHEGTPTVEVKKADLRMLFPEAVQFHCERFCVQADQEIAFESHGQLRATASEHLDLSAQEISLHASLGDILLKANDFVRALGQKILLNTDVDPEHSKAQAQRFLRKLLGYTPTKPLE